MGHPLKLKILNFLYKSHDIFTVLVDLTVTKIIHDNEQIRQMILTFV